jgi:hypothetical protein
LDEPQNLAISTRTERRHGEIVQVKWNVNDPNIKNAVDFDVFLDNETDEEFAKCMESPEEKLK